MKYILNFSLGLTKEGSHIIYEPEKFSEKPIAISVPDVVEIFKSFIQSFEEVGIIDKASPPSIQSKDKKDTDNPSNQEQLSEQKLITTSSALKGLSGQAYICKSKELDETALNQFCIQLTEYLQICCSKFSSPESFLSEENNLYVSGLREVFELRNYLARYTRSHKKSYQNGYLYVMVV